MIISKIIENYDVYIDTNNKRVMIKEISVKDLYILKKAFKGKGYNFIVG